MKKHILAGFILFAIPAFIFANNTYFSFDKKDNTTSVDNISYEYLTTTLDTIPEIKKAKKSNRRSNNKGEKLFNDLSYLTSADHFLKMEADGELTTEDKEKLADSYRLNSMTEDAEYWYAQIINNTSSAEVSLHYAEMLQSNGKCEDASRWFKTYVKKSGDKSRTFIENCNELDNIPEMEGVTVQNIESLNTEGLDFSPIKYKNGIVFSSTRGTSRSTKNIDKWTKENFSDLFFAEKSKEEFFDIKPIKGINGKFHDGTATFNQSGNYMIFSRNSKKGKSRKGVRELKLIEADLKDGRWTNIKGLNINNNDYPTCHPTLSVDGHRLYFSSDRPGGYGGMDIYISKKISGKWSDPQNLGPIVNTSGNELFPYIHSDEKLYFSSNGHKGVGGLDIFVVEKSNKSDETTWSIRSNLGRPFNSPKDDVGFTIVKTNESGYFASSRAGGMGKDDIYAWTMDENAITEVEKKQIDKSFCVYNIINNERIANVDVSVVSGDFQTDYNTPNLTLLPYKKKKNEYVLDVKDEEKTYMANSIAKTDKNGNFNYLMESDLDYFFILNKDGYAPVKHHTDFITVKKRNEYCIAMAPQSGVTMTGSVVNQEYNRPIPFADVEIFNRCTGEISNTKTDKKGAFESQVDCNCEYEIMATKERFNQGVILFSTMNDDCQIDDLEIAMINLTLVDRPAWNNSAMDGNSNSRPNGYGNHSQYGSNNGGNFPQQHPFNNTYSKDQGYGVSPNGNEAPVTKEALVEYFTGDENTIIRAGQKLTLKNIYYDFDKHYIRSDAGFELDYIVTLMQMQPTIEISLTAHTDSQGGNNYNQTLSQKRAEAAKAYLISKGISSSRINDAIGMGEDQPIIPCNGDCSNRDHQTNRRTEITIDKI